MRPRVFPAEDLPHLGKLCSGMIRFNEAAGIPRGRLYTAHRLPMFVYLLQ